MHILKESCILWTLRTVWHPNWATFLSLFVDISKATRKPKIVWKPCAKQRLPGKELSTHLKDKMEKIEQTINAIIEQSEKGKLIVVEGQKDEQTLRDLGITGPVLTLKTGGKSFLDATMQIEELKVEEVILLLDFDRRGKEATKRLQHDLERSKIKANMRLWRQLHGLVGREVQCIESLDNYLRTLNKKTVE